MNDSLKGSGIMTSELLPVFKRWLISRINGIIQKNISENVSHNLCSYVMIASSELCWDVFSHFCDASKNSWRLKG